MVGLLLAMLAAGGQVACGHATGTDTSGSCGQAPMTSQPRRPHTGPTGAAGSASVPRHSAPPPSPSPSPSPPPSPVDGRLALTAANSGQTIDVPAATVIEVRLEPVSSSIWTVPESSDPQALPRLSASDACDTVKVATFRAVNGGQIIATRPQGDAEARLVVTIRVTG
jgi:hypothetical protein